MSWVDFRGTGLSKAIRRYWVTHIIRVGGTVETMRRGVVVVLAALSFAGCAASDRSEGDELEEASAADPQLREVLDSYYAALSARDWPAFENHFWPGAAMTTVWTPEGEISPRVVATSVPDFVAQAPQGPGSREIFEETLVSVEITTEGDMAQAWARYSARFGDPGDVVEWEGWDAFTLLRHDGEWRITSLAYVPESN